jgi:hypothetical protein
LLVEEKTMPNLTKQFHKMFFKFIDSFMNSGPCFNSPHSQDFMDSNYDVYRPTPYHNSSPCEDLDFIEEVNIDEAFEKYAPHPIIGHDPILHYAKAI